MNKRGLSQVIAILLFILLGIVLIGVIWILISNLILDQSETINILSNVVNERVEVRKIEVDQSNPLEGNISLEKISGKIIFDGNITIPGQSKEVDLVSVVDTSGSMSECNFGAFDPAPGSPEGNCCAVNITRFFECVPPNATCSTFPCKALETNSLLLNCTSQCGGTPIDRLSPIKQANRDLASDILSNSNNRVGLSVYNNAYEASLSSSLTNSLSTINSKIDLWWADDSTKTCIGIIEATNKFQVDPTKEKVMIVMSDGTATKDCVAQLGSVPDHNGRDGANDSNDHAIEAAIQAMATVENLTIHSVGIGDGIEEVTLQIIANVGNGTYYKGNASEIGSIYKSIADQIIQQSQTIHSIDFLQIVFYGSPGTETIRVPPPEILQIKSYSFNFTNSSTISPPLKKIEVYPIIINSKGQEIVGPLLYSKNIN